MSFVLTTRLLSDFRLSPRRFVSTLLFCFIVSLVSVLRLADPVSAQDDGQWQIYLYANDVRDMAVSGGDIYAATSGGVVRLGDNFQQWNREPLGVLSDSLSCVDVDRAGNVWFGTEGAGISIFNPEEETWFPFTSLLEPIAGDDIRNLRFARNSEDEEVLLVATTQGYSVFVEGDLRFVCQEGVDICNLPSYDILDIAYDSSADEVWLATAGGVVVQAADGSWSERNPPTEIVIEHLGHSSGDTRAAGGNRVFVFADGSWSDDSEGLPSSLSVSSLSDGGAVLTATGAEGGVFRRTRSNGWERVGDRVFPATCVVNVPVEESGEGNGVGPVAGATDPSETDDGYWYAQAGVGWTQQRLAGPSDRAFYRSVHVDADDNVWFSTAQGGRTPLVGSFDGENWSILNGGKNDALRAWTWNILEVDDEFYLAHCCCSADAPICLLERVDAQGNFDNFPEIQEIWDMDRDDNGFIWATTNHGNESRSKGIYRVDPVTGDFDLFDRENLPLTSNQIPAIRLQGNVAWIGTFRDGVVRWNFGRNGIPEGDGEGSDDSFLELSSTAPEGQRIIGDAVRRLEIDSMGRVWIGTTSGLSLYDRGSIQSYGPRFDRVPAAEITALVTTPDGGAWVASRDTGITRLVPNPENEAGFLFTNYQSPLLPNPNVNALAVSNDGLTVWCGTSRGLASFRPFAGSTDDDAASLGIYPNPYVMGCTDGLRVLGAGGRVSGTVLDLDGSIMAEFDDVSPGDVIWDGRKDGESVAVGLYIVRLVGPKDSESVGVAIVDGDCR